MTNPDSRDPAAPSEHEGEGLIEVSDDLIVEDVVGDEPLGFPEPAPAAPAARREVTAEPAAAPPAEAPSHAPATAPAVQAMPAPTPAPAPAPVPAAAPVLSQPAVEPEPQPQLQLAPAPWYANPVAPAPAAPAPAAPAAAAPAYAAPVASAPVAPAPAATVHVTPPAPAPEKRSRGILVAAFVFGLGGIALGVAAGRGMLAAPLARLAELAAAPGARPPVPPAPAATAATAEPRPGTPSATASPAARPPTAPRKVAKAERALRKGVMKVTAPAEAEIILDGRRVGRGNVTLDVNEGAHRIEVRLGKAKVAERFSVAGGETWTYDVTPTQ